MNKPCPLCGGKTEQINKDVVDCTECKKTISRKSRFVNVEKLNQLKKLAERFIVGVEDYTNNGVELIEGYSEIKEALDE